MDKVFDELSISLATTDQIRSWSFGEVKKPETINYRTLKPEKEGLFDERIFGPTKDWECSCGRYKRIRYRGIICERCGVEVTRREVRRERMGHIELAAPVTHIWYFKGVPSRLGYFLDMSPKELEKVIYFAAYLVVSIDDKKRTKDLKEIEEAVVAEKEIVEEDFEDWEKKRIKQMKVELKAMEDAKVPEAEIKERKKEIEKEIKQKKGKSDAEIKVIEEAFQTLKTLKPKTLIENDTLWREMIDKYDEYFTGGMGAEAVRELVGLVDLKSEMEKLKIDLDSKSAQRRQRAIQRMKVIKPFAAGKNPPEAMVLEVIPVIPPELRPMVQLDGGRFATSDLNDLYRRLINRNNRLKKLLELGAPEIIISNEKRMLQESVDALFDNGRRGRAVAGAGGRGLKSLSDMLKGKQGRFRQNLLGKRVDYSARSVIVVGPHLELQQCGLPKMMALELFKPFVMKRLVDLGLAQNIKSAKRMVERSRAQVWDVLAEVILEHPVLLNRAPTLHRLGIQAFEPILVEGKAIQVHPLVCEAFNADFDGDQMAVHVPLSAEAQAEAMVLMLSTNNVLSPASGNPIVSPSQDMVIGLYYLTECHEDLNKAEFNFSDFNEAQIAYENGHIGLHTPINVRIGDLAGSNEVYEDLRVRFQGLITPEFVDGSKLIKTTLGRLHFNLILPLDFPFIQASIRKPEMKQIISEVIDRYNKAELRDFLDKMKNLGFKYGTKAGLTVAMTDIKTPQSKEAIVKKAEDETDLIQKQLDSDLITKKEAKNKKLDVWNVAVEKIQAELIRDMEKEIFNPVDMMVKSGARGNMLQVRQLGGMRGLVADPDGEMIESPIKSNFREGMSVLEYFISTHGARKGLADTALRTADSGYLTRRLVDVAAGVVIKDLGDENIDWRGTKKDIRDPKHAHSKLYGRVLANNIKSGNKIIETESGQKLTKGTFIDDVVLHTIEKSGIEEVYVLTPFNSLNPDSMDPLCYGFSLATGKPVEVGEAVGIIAAQSIGEPGTQLTMRTFHTGGSVQTTEGKEEVKEKVTKSIGARTEVFKIEVDSKTGIQKMYCLESKSEISLAHGKYVEIYDPSKDNTESLKRKFNEEDNKIKTLPKEISSLEELIDKYKKNEPDMISQNFKNKKEFEEFKRVYTANFKLSAKRREPKEKLLKEKYPNFYTIYDKYTEDLTVKTNKEEQLKKAQLEFNNYESFIKYFSAKNFEKFTTVIESPEKDGKENWEPMFESRYNVEQQKKRQKDSSRKKKEKYLTKKQKEDAKILGKFIIPNGPQTFFERTKTDEEGKIEYIPIRKQVILTGKEKSNGLPRIVEIFEARTPKGSAVLSPIEGKVKSIDITPEGNREITIMGEKEEISLLVLRRQQLTINQGDKIKAGDNITKGPKDPKDVLSINGVRTCQEYLVEEVQNTYRDQGVEVHDKHVEMIVRQMLRRVRIVRTNDSDFLPNELVDSTLFRNANQELVKKGKVPAEGRAELMGITKASLATDSWLSAASFQETTRVLTEAAMKKSTDALSGLKENVIIGTLIPAGTGSDAYQKLSPSLPGAPEVSELGFMEKSSDIEESEENSLPNPAQWLAMLGEEGDEETE